MSTPCVSLPNCQVLQIDYATTYIRARHQMLFKIHRIDTRIRFCVAQIFLFIFFSFELFEGLCGSFSLDANANNNNESPNIILFLFLYTRWNHNKLENICRWQHKQNPNSMAQWLWLCGLIFVNMVAGTRDSRLRDLFLLQAENVCARQRQMCRYCTCDATLQNNNVCVRKWVLRGFALVFSFAVRLSSYSTSTNRSDMNCITDTTWHDTMATYASNFCSPDFSLGSLFSAQFPLSVSNVFIVFRFLLRQIFECAILIALPHTVRRATFVFY